MVERMITMGNFVNISDVRRIVDVVKQIGDNEQLVLTMNSQDSYKAENIFSVLERHNFTWSTKGGHDGRDYYIIARKKD